MRCPTPIAISSICHESTMLFHARGNTPTLNNKAKTPAIMINPPTSNLPEILFPIFFFFLIVIAKIDVNVLSSNTYSVNPIQNIGKPCIGCGEK